MKQVTEGSNDMTRNLSSHAGKVRGGKHRLWLTSLTLASLALIWMGNDRQTGEGRNDDILRFTDMDGRNVPIMAMAMWSVIKDTPGVYRFQPIQTASRQLKMRLQTKVAGEETQVWELVKQRAPNYLATHGLTNVQIFRAQEPPAPNPISGKFRQCGRSVESSKKQVLSEQV